MSNPLSYWFASNAGGWDPDLIPNSLRLRGNSAALVRTSAPSSPNGLKWTYSGWYKNGDGYDQNQGVLWGCAPASTLYGRIEIRGTRSSGEVYMTNNHSSGGGQAWNCRCEARLRDPGAWYHLVVVYDSAQSTSSDRIKFYINGVQYGSDNNSYPGQNVGGLLNAGYSDAFGRGQGAFNSWCAQGYMAEVRVCDDQAYGPENFGEYNDSGVWVPKAPADIDVNYGSAGVYFPMTPGSVQTNLGGSDTFIAENIEQSNTGSTDYDVMNDSPSNNYSVVSPLSQTNPTRNITRNANLNYYHDNSALGTIMMKRQDGGKYYCEMTTISNPGTGTVMIGLYNHDAIAWYDGPGRGDSVASYVYRSDSHKRNNNSTINYGSNWFGNGNVVSMLVDMDAGTISYKTNGSDNGTAFSGLPDGRYTVEIGATGGTFTTMVNAGQRPFLYAIPDGYEPLSTAGLPEVTISDPREYFDVLTYNGPGNSSAYNVSGLAFQPDLVWMKNRNNGGAYHRLWDSVRGADKSLVSSLSDSEDTSNARGRLTSFNDGGFTTQWGSTDGRDVAGLTNDHHVAWCWKKQSGVFDVVSYSGTNSAQSIAHNLGAVPALMIIKATNANSSWQVYHQSLGNQAALFLNQSSTGVRNDNTRWNSTSPTSTNFTVGTDGGMNGSGREFVAYLWAEVPGFSSFGQYKGNSNSDGPVCYTGFRPAFVLFKAAKNENDSWFMYDVKRDTYNPSYKAVRADSTAEEKTSSQSGDIPIDILSNGFKIRFSGTAGNGASGEYIWMAFAEHPFGAAGLAPAPAR